MKTFKKIISALFAIAFIGCTMMALTACGGTKVEFFLPDGVTATLPEAIACEAYDEVTLPAITVSKEHYEQIGWEDEYGEYYANGEKITVGGEGLKLTAVLRGKEIFVSYCEDAGNFFMAGKGSLGPSPAYTHFYADYTWEAIATGKAMYTNITGTWSVDSNGNLSMKYTNQDGFAKTDDVVIDSTTDARMFSWTFQHPSDRGGYKYHKNHADKAALLQAVKNEFGSSFTVPAASSYTITYRPNGGVGDQIIISGTVGQEVTLPACAFTHASKSFSGWKVGLAESVTLNAGEKFVMVSFDINVDAQWA